MKKLYFAMVPESSLLENILAAVGVGTGLYYGAKYLLGDKKFGEYKQKIKGFAVSAGQQAKPAGQGPDTGMGIHDDDARAKEEDDILARIRKAAQKQ